MKNIPFILGAALLLINAGRFWANGDVVGASIAGMTACLASSWPYIQNKHRRGSKND